jgi:hypothetical protein
MPRHVPKQDDNEVVELVLDLRRLRQIIKDAEADIHNDAGTGVQDVLLQVMDEMGKVTVTIRGESSGTRLTAARIDSAREVIDEAKLKKQLGSALWSKVTTLALDHKKLQDAMAKGLVDPNVVAQCAESVHHRPYVKISERKA